MRNPFHTAPTRRDSEFAWTPALIVALTAICLAQILEALDITVVNIALPTLRTDLGFSERGLQWVITGYTMCFAGFLLPAGRIGDLYGYRRVFVTGTSLFALASLACAAAGNATELVGARCVQGVAAGFVSPMTLALLAAIFPEGRPRTVALTVWGGATAVSGSLGFIIGGLLVDGPGWRWIFAVNPAVCVLVLAAVLRFVPRDRARERRLRFDTVGTVTSTGAIGLLVYALSRIGSPLAAAVLIPLAGAAILGGYFVLHQWRSSSPLVSPQLFTIRAVVAANTAQILISGAIYALFFLLSLVLQQSLGQSATQAGLALVPFSVLLFTCAGVGPILVRYIGFRGSIASGGLLGAAGLILVAYRVGAGGVAGSVIVPSLVVALGFACTFVPVTLAAVSGVPHAQHGIASGLVNVTRTLGGAVGLAIISALATTRTNALLHAGHAIGDASAAGYRLGLFVAAAFMVAAAATALLLFRDEGRGQHVRMSDISGL